MIDMTQYPGPEGAEPPPGVEPAPPLQAFDNVDRAYRRPLVASRHERDRLCRGPLSPIEHAWSNNREYLIGELEDGWWLALEVGGKITRLASPFRSEQAAKDRAEALEADRR